MSTPLMAHCYHMVEPSPWPILASMGAGLMTSGLACWIHSSWVWGASVGAIVVALTSVQWWRDVNREAAMQGHHTFPVQFNMRWGMVLFITSEVLFFFSFFWGYFNMSLAPGLEIGMVWPPVGVTPFDPMGIPLLNTSLLLSSGFTVTWCHHNILLGEHTSALVTLGYTVALGVIFTAIQGYEYTQASFTFADSSYGSCFFIATGFHGLHVIIGSIFLTATWFRIKSGQLSSKHHFGFEAAAWYWHFVDVVWIFLFMTIYWWGYT